MKWDSVIATGMLSLNENDNEETIRQSIINESLSNKFPVIGSNDFEFVTVRQKKISPMEQGPGTEYSFAVVKKMAGQGLLYVRIKRGYEFFYAHSNHGLETSYLEKPGENNNHTVSIHPAHSADHILFSPKMARINSPNFLIKDTLLQPVAQKQQSYIKDTTDFINFIKNKDRPGCYFSINGCLAYK